MRITVDGQPHPVLQSAPSNVSAIIAEIDEVLEHRGRGVRQIVINGEVWSLERLDSELTRLNATEVDTLDVRTESMHVLAEESLAEIEDVINELPVACHSLAALLNSPDREAALHGYADFVDIWAELLGRHRDVLEALSVSPSSVSVNEVSLDSWHASVWKLVQRGADLAASKDTVKLADLLTYDVMPYAEEESSVLERLRALARGPQSG